MANFARKLALVALTSAFAAPALAVPVGASPPATATARIVRPLTLAANSNLDFGTIVMSSVSGNNTVALDQTNLLTCGAGAELVCSGTTTVASYTVKGTNNQTVKVYTATSTLAGSNGGSLIFTPNAPATVSLGAAGASTGATFSVGGSIVVGLTTTDGVYLGNMDVTVDYN